MTQKSNPQKNLELAKHPEPAVPMTRINALIPTSEHQKMKIYAVKNQTTITELLRDFIKTIPD